MPQQEYSVRQILYFVFQKNKQVFRIFVSAGENRGTSLKTGIGSMQGTSAGG